MLDPKDKKGAVQDESQFLLNQGYGLDFYHVPSGRSVTFKAFLTAYEDAFNSSWNMENVYGRNDPIHTFQGTTRTISLGWDVPAASLEEGKINFSNASLLYSMLYPTYDEEGTISAPPLIKIKFANLIVDAAAGAFAGNAKSSGLLGHIEGVSFAPDLDTGFFDDKYGHLIPKTINLSCTFHVLHMHPLGWNQDETPGLRQGDHNFPFDAKISEASSYESMTGKKNNTGSDDAANPGDPDSKTPGPVSEAAAAKINGG